MKKIKTLKKIATIFIAFIVLTYTIAGCTSKKQDTDAVVTGGEGKYASDKPLNLTIHLHYYNSTVFDDSWLVFKEAAKKTNITLTGTVSKSATDSNQVFNIMMASKELPDIIHTQRLKAIKYGQEGAMIPLNDLIDKYAPNIKKFFEEKPEVKKHLTAPDGNIYMISFVGDGETASGYFIRKDWLDKLGLKIPETVEDYYNVLTAFKNDDPNGNGMKDEVPLFFRNKPEARRLVTLFGARTGWYVEGNKVKYGEYTPEFKDAITNVAKWYKERIIDQEVFTRAGNVRDELLGKNIGGATHDWFGSTADYNTKLKDKIPGFNFIPMPPPIGTDGKAIEETYRSIVREDENGWCISAGNKYPVETIKYFDFWFTEEGRRLMNYGIEGVHYDMVDGKPTIKPELLNSNESVLTQVKKDGVQIEIGFHQDFEFEKQWINEIARQGMEMYINNGYIVDPFPSLVFLEEEQKIIDQKWTAIATYMEEMNQKWILGAEDPQATFDVYMGKLKAMGMDDIVNVYQKAYDRYNSND